MANKLLCHLKFEDINELLEDMGIDVEPEVNTKAKIISFVNKNLFSLDITQLLFNVFNSSQFDYIPEEYVIDFIKKGVDINALVDGESLLDIVSERGMINTVKFLLAFGADPSYPAKIDGKVSSPIFYAIRQKTKALTDVKGKKVHIDKNRIKIVDILIKAGAKLTPSILDDALAHSAFAKDLDLVKYFVILGAKDKYKDRKSSMDSALHWAFAHKNKSMVDVILNGGAISPEQLYVFAQDKFSNTNPKWLKGFI